MTILPERPVGPSRRLPSGPWLVVAVVMVLAVVVAAVVFATRGGSSATRSVQGGVKAAKPEAWKISINAVSQPAPVAGRFVVYAAADGKLQLVGLNAASGRTAWTVPASPSEIAPGTPPKLAVVGNRVVYLQDVDGTHASVVAVDAAKGAVAWRSPPGTFTDWPSVCLDDAAAVCVSGQLQGGSTGVLRFNAATGQALPSPQVGSVARELVANLFDVGQRHPEILVATSAGSVAWQRTLREIFTLSGASTDYGWNFDRVPRVGLYVGSVGVPPVVQTSTRYAVDMSRTMTVGFRISDGAPVWRDAGSQYLCGYLSCPGAINSAYSSTADARAGGPMIGLRLRARGVLSGTPTSLGATASPDARGVLEGFDVASGRTRWRFDFGRDVGLLTQIQLPPRIAAQSIVLRTKAGHLVALDVLSGTASPVNDASPAWCSKVVSYHMTIPYQAGGHSLHDYVGQYALAPCTPSGRSTNAPARGSAAMAGLAAGCQGELAWMEKGAVVAVPA